MKNLFEKPYLFRATAALGGVLLGSSLLAYLALYLLLRTERLEIWAGIMDFPPSLSQRIDMMVLFAMVLFAAVASFLILVVGLFATHRVAGPLYRLEHLTLEAMDGRIPGDVRFRKGDQMACLAEGQAKLFSLLKMREMTLRERLNRVWEAKRRLAETAEGKGEWAQRVEDLRQAYLSLVEATAKGRP